MVFRTILCASDGFEHSDRALRHAAELAAQTGAELHVVHVAESSLSADLLGGEHIQLTPAERRIPISTQIGQLARDLRVCVTPHFEPYRGGAVAEGIAWLADDLSADPIVVGSRR